LVKSLACLAEAPKERRQVSLVFETFQPRPPAQAVLTKTTKMSTKDTKTPRQPKKLSTGTRALFRLSRRPTL
jgi:hypothetical protein